MSFKHENTYIMNLDGAYLYRDVHQENKTTIKGKDLAKMFSVTIPYSLETIRMNDYYPDCFYIKNRKQYSKAIINVTFDMDYYTYELTGETYVDEETGEIKEKYKKKTLANKRKIRNYFYKNGVDIDGLHYKFYKRGAGKAKNGYALFIQEDMCKKLLERSRLGIVFDENEELDITSLLAYESLVTSGLDSIINLDPLTEIVIIDDIDGIEFSSKASVTREIDGELVTRDEILKLRNCLTDGQGLLDRSVFEKYDKSDKGFMLLRSDMFKCCAFNTNLQDWFEYNNIDEITDMFGNKYDAKKVKLITTPNSFKFLKFAYKIGNGTKAECFDYYINNIDSTFGVVKYDKEGNYGEYNRTTYQLLNSIPNISYDDLMSISEEERKYVDWLKNDIAVFRHHIGCDVHGSLELEENMNSETLGMYQTADVMNMLMLVNSDFQYTKKFRDIRKDMIRNYTNNLKLGKMRLEGSKYMTLFSNPFEMLLATIGKYDGTSIMKGRETYAPHYKVGQEFCISRNPHINAGNVMCSKNVHHDEYKWFNLTNNIAVVNSYDNDMPDRLQGCDFDSDTAQYITHPILVEKAKYCEENYTTPINRVKGKSTPRKYNMKQIAKLDIILSDNYIGKIVNLSQVINSYMNHLIQNNGDSKDIEALYHASSRLSSMSQIEIDKAKKVFDNVNMRKEISNIKKMPQIEYKEVIDEYGKEINCIIVPDFFEKVSDSRFQTHRHFDTPMDMLQDVMKLKKAKYNYNLIPFDDLMVKKTRGFGRYRVEYDDSIFNAIESCGKRLIGLRMNEDLNEKAKSTITRMAKHEAIEKISTFSITNKIVYNILKDAFSKDGRFKKYAMLTLNLLFDSNKLYVLNCFKNIDMSEDEVLVESSVGEYNLFGETFEKIKRKDLLK